MKNYESGYKAGYEKGWAACLSAFGYRRRRLVSRLFKYTDAPGVVYDTGAKKKSIDKPSK